MTATLSRVGRSGLAFGGKDTSSTPPTGFFDYFWTQVRGGLFKQGLGYLETFLEFFRPCKTRFICGGVSFGDKRIPS
ncbi:hypothetical protein J6590_061797 [Homalodisca vitripennis]|nr:hypothetical protein J6590_061797 [Homalodisca vitripennis]